MQVVGYVIVFFPVLLMVPLYLFGRRDRERSAGAAHYAARGLLILTVLVTGAYGFIGGAALAWGGYLPTPNSGAAVLILVVWAVSFGVAGVILVLAVWRLSHRNPLVLTRTT